MALRCNSGLGGDIPTLFTVSSTTWGDYNRFTEWLIETFYNLYGLGNIICCCLLIISRRLHLWQYALMCDFHSAVPLGDQAIDTITRYPTQTYTQSAGLGNEKYTFLRHWFDSPGRELPTFCSTYSTTTSNYIGTNWITIKIVLKCWF